MNTKRTVLILFILFMLCIVVPYSIVLYRNDGLTLFFEIPPGATDADIAFEPEGIIQAENKAWLREKNILQIKFQMKSSGNTTATLHWNDVSDPFYAEEISMPLHAYKWGIVSDGLTYNFTGWQYFFFGLALFFVCAAFVLAFEAICGKRKYYFSYVPARVLSFSLFFAVVGFLRLGYLASFLYNPESGTVWALLVGYIVSAQSFIKWTAPFLLLFACWLGISNIGLMRHEGIRTANMLGIGVGFLILCGASLGIWMAYARILHSAWNFLCNAYAGIFVYAECQLIATMGCALYSAKHEPQMDKDFIVILGCKIRADGSLYPLIKQRVDRAVAFANKQRQLTGKMPILIPSGGKGPDEPISEAEAMANYLKKQGIETDYVLPETMSRTTRENMIFSKKIIERYGGGKAIFSTSGYHVLRSGILARNNGWNIDGIGCATKWYFWPNAFLREFIGLLAESVFQQLAAAAFILAISVFLTMLI